ncbi:hypothetical protein ACJMK2_006201, partial [Sinanodonta woodiana]
MEDEEFQLKIMKKRGKKYVWPDKQDQSWEMRDNVVATVGEPTMTDKREHCDFETQKLENLKTNLLKDYKN